MSDSDERFHFLRDILPYNFEAPTKGVTDSINCGELAARSADVDLEQPPVPPTPGPAPQQELDWCVLACVGISLTECESFLLPIYISQNVN